MRSISPLPHSLPYQHNYPQYNSPYPSPIPPSLNYNNYAGYSGDMRTMVDVTPSWNHNCQSHLPSYDFLPAHPQRTMQVNSDSELQHVLSGLTAGSASLSSIRSY
jgi:hypothetical protein